MSILINIQIFILNSTKLNIFSSIILCMRTLYIWWVFFAICHLINCILFTGIYGQFFIYIYIQLEMMTSVNKNNSCSLKSAILYAKLLWMFIYLYIYKYFSHDNYLKSLAGDGYDNVNVFGLGGIDLLHRCWIAAAVGYCCSCRLLLLLQASTGTCYCQCIWWYGPMSI